MIVPEAHAHVRRVQVPKKAIYLGAIVVVALVGALLSLIVHYAYIVGQVFGARTLRDENMRLKGRLATLQSKFDPVDGRIVQLQQFDEKLRAMTDLRDEERGLSMGP